MKRKENKIIKNYILNGTVNIPDIDFYGCEFFFFFPENPIKVETKNGLQDPFFCPMCSRRLRE